jgi:hypothetical protein
MSKKAVSRNMFSSPLEDEICERINDIVITLTNQERYIKNNLPTVDSEPFLPTKLVKEPNYKALSAGFKGLHIGNRNAKYHNVYLGVLSLHETDIIIEKTRDYSIEDKRIRFIESIYLIDLLQNIYEISEEQLRNLERVLFLFEA